MRQPRAILIIMDGWGHGQIKDGNAIVLAKKPNFDSFWKNYPHTLLSASGEEVGLPWGEIGSSEVGHLSIGSGRVVYQNLPKVTRSINDGTFYANKALIDAINHARQQKSNLHLVGLVSAGGVHSHISHLEALLTLLKKQGFKGKTYVHMFTDGRDTPTKTAPMYLKKLKEVINKLSLNTQIASIVGRYFSMDRDNHWDRTFAAYKLLTEGIGETATSPEEAIDNAYKRKETDEFIQPSVILNTPQSNFLSHLMKQSPEKPQPTPIQSNDSVIFFNFRPDRMRQIVELFLFERPDLKNKVLKNLFITTLTEYNSQLPVHVAVPPEHISTTVAKILSDNHLTQLHIAETEKYAHVTYFFDGGNPEPSPGEKWYLIPSPKVPTYDKKPEMSAKEIIDYVIESQEKTPYDFILINFANADMVGHTGNLEATIEGVEAIDAQLGRLHEAFPDSYLIISADHGNAEVMVNTQTKEMDTEHSINPVPFIAIHPSLKLTSPQPTPNQATGIIPDIGPTVLALYNINPPKEMTGYNLLESLAPNYKASLPLITDEVAK